MVFTTCGFCSSSRTFHHYNRGQRASTSKLFDDRQSIIGINNSCSWTGGNSNYNVSLFIQSVIKVIASPNIDETSLNLYLQNVS